MKIVKNNLIQNTMIKEVRRLLMQDDRSVRRLIGIDSTNITIALPLRSRDFSIWIAILEKNVIGYISFGKGNDGETFIKALYIAKEFRRRGFGEKLLRAFLIENPNISARVNQGNEAMYGLFKKLGVKGENNSTFYSKGKSMPIWWSNYKIESEYI